jgi:O-antigen/teichoic acid export membrane protein
VNLRSRTRGIAAIALGSALGQAAALAGAPFLSRLFSPADFGLFTVITSLAVMLSPAIAGRYELAVPLPRSDDDARALVATGFVLSIATTATLVVVAWAIRGPVADLLDTPEAARWLPIMPVVAATLAWFMLLNQWALRLGRYAVTARRNVFQGVSTVVLQVSAGVAGAAGGGLISGYAGGQLLGALTMVRSSGLGVVPRARMRAVAHRYRRFPALLAPGGVLNVAGVYAPPLFVAALFGTSAAGSLGFTQRILALPVTLVGAAVGQVYLSELAVSMRDKVGHERALFREASKRLLVLGILGAVVLLILGPWLFALVFGPQWHTSGRLAQALAVSLAAQLVASPISQTLIVYERTALQFAWDSARLGVTCAALVIPATLGWSLVASVWTMSLASTAMYALSWELSRRTLMRQGVNDRAP